jgi:hypothetical protein
MGKLSEIAKRAWATRRRKEAVVAASSWNKVYLVNYVAPDGKHKTITVLARNQKQAKDHVHGRITHIRRLRKM